MNLKKMLCVLLMVVLTITVFTGCQEKEEDVIELRLAHFFPETHPAEKILVDQWIEEIKEATDGKVLITSYPGGTLLGAKDIYSGVVEGTADIGLSCFAYTRGRFPVLEAFELPGIVYKNSKAASMAAWEGIMELEPDEVKDTKLLMVIATGPGDLFSKEPIKKLEDIENMSIRATGISAQTIKLLGAVPEGMDQSETYEALSKGIVSANLSPVEVLKGWKHAEVIDYITFTPFLYNTLFFVTMNQEKWNEIPEETQEIIEEITRKFHEETAISLWDMQNEEALEYAVEEHDIEVIELSKEEQERWIDKVIIMQEEFKAEMKKNGYDENILDVVSRLAEKYNDVY